MDGNSGDFLRNDCTWRRGEEQFVIFAAMQCEVESGWRTARTRSFDGERVHWDGCRVELGRKMRLITDMSKISREAVAYVDSCVSQPRCREFGGNRESRLRKEMRMIADGLGESGKAAGSALKRQQFRGGTAERTGNVDQVSGAGSGAKQSSASPDRADQNDVEAGKLRGPRGVSSGKRNAALLGEREQAIEEAVDPGLAFAESGEFAGHSERKKRGQRARTHGGKIAEPACQAAVAYRLGRVPITAEVHAFQRKVGGDDDFFTLGRAQDSAIIADSEAQSGRGLLDATADGFNKRLFAQKPRF